jgi:uncharacterized protein YxeA
MNKILIVICLCLLLVGALFIFHNLNKPEVKLTATNTGIYQGPIQEGYNETLFRETGRYEKIGENN